MIDIQRLMRINAKQGRKPHLVQINEQWLCIGEVCIGAGDDMRAAFDRRAEIRAGVAFKPVSMLHVMDQGAQLAHQQQHRGSGFDYEAAWQAQHHE